MRTAGDRLRVLLVVVGAAFLLAGAVPADGYRPPVDAPVLDPFRPPPQPWMPGNRGIEYATVPGTPVRAIGPGTVTFAGLVAGSRIVTVTHPDGLRSSYVGLAQVRVEVGDRVAAGAVVGLAADRLHLGVRRGRTYLDPASLWGRSIEGHVVLVDVGDGGDGPAEPTTREAGGPTRSRRFPGLATMAFLGPSAGPASIAPRRTARWTAP